MRPRHIWHFSGAHNSSVWLQLWHLEGRRKVIRNEPEEVNWEQMIKVIISSLGKETQDCKQGSRVLKQPGKPGAFEFRILRAV